MFISMLLLLTCTSLCLCMLLLVVCVSSADSHNLIRRDQKNKLLSSNYQHTSTHFIILRSLSFLRLLTASRADLTKPSQAPNLILAPKLERLMSVSGCQFGSDPLSLATNRAASCPFVHKRHPLTTRAHTHTRIQTHLLLCDQLTFVVVSSGNQFPLFLPYFLGQTRQRLYLSI